MQCFPWPAFFFNLPPSHLCFPAAPPHTHTHTQTFPPFSWMQNHLRPHTANISPPSALRGSLIIHISITELMVLSDCNKAKVFINKHTGTLPYSWGPPAAFALLLLQRFRPNLPSPIVQISTAIADNFNTPQLSLPYPHARTHTRTSRPARAGLHLVKKSWWSWKANHINTEGVSKSTTENMVEGVSSDERFLDINCKWVIALIIRSNKTPPHWSLTHHIVNTCRCRIWQRDTSL